MLPILPQNVQHPSGNKDSDGAHGAGGFESPMSVCERGAEPNILVHGETLGAFPRPLPGGAAVASAAPLFCAGVGREKADTSTNESFTWLAFTGSQ